MVQIGFSFFWLKNEEKIFHTGLKCAEKIFGARCPISKINESPKFVTNYKFLYSEAFPTSNKWCWKKNHFVTVLTLLQRPYRISIQVRIPFYLFCLPWIMAKCVRIGQCTYLWGKHSKLLPFETNWIDFSVFFVLNFP